MSIAEHRRVLFDYFFDERRVSSNPQWQEVPSSVASWRVLAVVEQEDDSKTQKLVTVRNSLFGDIDSFCFSSEDPNGFDYVHCEAATDLLRFLQDLNAQVELGMLAGSEGQEGLVQELAEVVSMMAELDGLDASTD